MFVYLVTAFQCKWSALHQKPHSDLHGEWMRAQKEHLFKWECKQRVSERDGNRKSKRFLQKNERVHRHSICGYAPLTHSLTYWRRWKNAYIFLCKIFSIYVNQKKDVKPRVHPNTCSKPHGTTDFSLKLTLFFSPSFFSSVCNTRQTFFHLFYIFYVVFEFQNENSAVEKFFFVAALISDCLIFVAPHTSFNPKKIEFFSFTCQQ